MTTAISAPSAREPTNYQRLEFLGDSILKLSTSLALSAKHLNYHEGMLSHKKDHIVSNGSLARAALRAGLDAYILTRPFTGRKPLYIVQVLSSKHQRAREMSTKILADVVEALIGVAYLDGGLKKAITCLTILLPEVSWSCAEKAPAILLEVYKTQNRSLVQPTHVEKLIQYDFDQKILLMEALTHPSFQDLNMASSYQRLEFIGDGILDNIVTTRSFNHDPVSALEFPSVSKPLITRRNTNIQPR